MATVGTMMLSMEPQSLMAGPELIESSGSPLTGSRRSSHSRLYKGANARKKSLNVAVAGTPVPANAATSTTSPSPVTAFPSFDPAYGQSTTNCTPANAHPDTMPLFGRTDEFLNYHEGAITKKLKPLIRHSSSRDRGHVPIDLNMTKAENERRGALPGDSPRHSTNKLPNSRTGLGGHARTISAASQMSSSSTASGHYRTTAYQHPARQVPHSPTPPVPAVMPQIEAEASRPSSSGSNLANVPSLPPPGYRAYVGGGVLRSNTVTPTGIVKPPTPTIPASTTFSTSVSTSRNSIDSTFKERLAAGLSGRHRSRTNSNALLDPDEEARAMAVLRADFNAREALKEEKYRRIEEKRERRRSEAEERKARRQRGNSGATQGSTGSGIAASSKSDPLGGACSGSGSGSGPSPKKKKSRSNSNSNGNGNGKKHPSSARVNEKAGRQSVDQLEGIRYDMTAQSRRPTLLGADFDEMDEKDEVAAAADRKIPKRGKVQGFASAGKATQSAWMTFWFRVKTALMRMMANRKK